MIGSVKDSGDQIRKRRCCHAVQDLDIHPRPTEHADSQGLLNQDPRPLREGVYGPSCGLRGTSETSYKYVSSHLLRRTEMVIYPRCISHPRSLGRLLLPGSCRDVRTTIWLEGDGTGYRAEVCDQRVGRWGKTGRAGFIFYKERHLAAERGVGVVAWLES